MVHQSFSGPSKHSRVVGGIVCVVCALHTLQLKLPNLRQASCSHSGTLSAHACLLLRAYAQLEGGRETFREHFTPRPV